jgi:cyclopropane fatty-acyl-phospholipid synthase-like methyltransferase
MSEQRPDQPDYTSYAPFYDYFELGGQEESEDINIFLDELFKLNGIKSVLDFACGTGAQAVGLARAGYQVTAADLNEEMLEIARKKAAGMKIEFVNADMRTAELGRHDAVICLFNAIGHLSHDECRAFFKRAYNHLNPQGIFVTDIINFTAMTSKAFAHYRRLRREAIIDGMLVQHSRRCSLHSKSRQLKIASITRAQDGTHKPTEIVDDWQMQLYDNIEMREMLQEAGFSEIGLFSGAGCAFSPTNSENILAIGQKQP